MRAVLSLAGLSAASARPSTAVLSIQAPAELRGDYAGFVAMFSGPLPSQRQAFDLWTPAGNILGCADYADGSKRGGVVIVRRGNCSFVRKAQLAQAAGALGVLVVSDTEQMQVMGGDEKGVDLQVFAVNVQRSLGDRAFKWLGGHPGEPVQVEVRAYVGSVLDVSEAILMCMATSLVAAGAFFSTSDLRHGSPIAPKHDEVVELNNELAFGLCAMGSAALLTFYLFMNYMIYFIMFAFCTGGASCIIQFGSMVLQYAFPTLRQRFAQVPLLGPVVRADVAAAIPAVALVAAWVWFRNTAYGWFFQDIIGAGFLCWLQRSLRLPNAKIATLLLTAMFFFDIFWVFISPFFFRKSVMVVVATGGDTGEAVPMLLRVPSIGDPFGHDRMLGFGDVALPGLLVSYLRRHDVLSKRRFTEGYFGPALAGYFLGLCATVTALSLMRMAQPALLYLVPGTLGTALALATSRKELALLWVGTPAGECHVPEEVAEEERAPMAPQTLGVSAADLSSGRA